MICLYNKDETDFTTNGICVLTPTVCTVSEVAGGSYELYLEHPIDEQGKSQLIVENMLIKAPVPPMSIPDITLPEVKLWRTKVATDLYSKLPVTKYPPSVSSDIKKVRANPLAYLWNPLILYAPGALVATGVGAGASIYRAVMPSQGVQPPAAIFWGYAAPVVGQQPTYTPGTVAESLSANELVSKIADYSAEWIQVRSLRGTVGYVRRDDCEETTEVHAGEVIPGHEITEQVFRIYNIECEDDTHLVCVNAKHISYDFQGNSLYDCNVQDADPMTAIAIIQGSLMIEDDRRIASDITNRLISQDWSFKNPINALLDPSSGMVKATGARLIRDNKDFFLLNSANAKRGISLSYGVNLRGVKWTRSVENVITRVVPRCSDESDGYLYITDGGPIVNGVVRNDGEMWVDSPIAGQYPFIKIEVLDCKYKVGEEYEKPDGTKEKRTEASCRADMKADAVRRFTDDVVDGIDITLEVEFVLLGDTEKYKQYKGLQRVNIYDIISVNTGLSGISANAQVNEYEYDCILKRYNSIKLGSVNSFQRRVPGYRVVNQSITYEKLSPDLINRIKTMNAGGSTSSGSSTPSGSNSNVTYVANSKADDGVVTKGNGQSNKVWKTDAQGNPAWREEAGAITVTDGDPTLAWGTRSKVGSVGNTDLHVTMPGNPAPAVIDNLSSTSATDALSANQGRVLNSNIAPYNLGSISSMADLKTAITNYVATQPGQSVRYIQFYPNFTDASAGFSPAAYGERIGEINIRSEGRFSCLITFQNGTTTLMANDNGTWIVDTFALNSKITSINLKNTPLYEGIANANGTFNLTGGNMDDYTYIYVYVGSGGIRGSMYIPVSLFKIKPIYLPFIYGGTMREIDIQYVSGTQIKVTSNPGLNETFEIFGCYIIQN